MQNNAIKLVILLAGIGGAFAQGFVNLDFESANLSGYGAGSVPATNAIPGWTAYLGGTNLANINYNESHYGGNQVCLVGSTNFQGNYYILLQGSMNEAASIGQTGTIPTTAESLTWWGTTLDSLTFNGQPLTYGAIGSGSGYTIYAANISAFAGETGQLLFSSIHFPLTPGDIIDNIQFSSSPVPEPSVLGLFGVVSAALLWPQQRKTQMNSARMAVLDTAKFRRRT